jgi:hypothetical protein
LRPQMQQDVTAGPPVSGCGSAGDSSRLSPRLRQPPQPLSLPVSAPVPTLGTPPAAPSPNALSPSAAAAAAAGGSRSPPGEGPKLKRSSKCVV